MEIGEKFGRLTVQEIIGKSAVCVCECGGKKLAYCSYLERGLIKSCGCLEKETRINKAKKWGEKETEKSMQTKEELYRIDDAMSYTLRKKKYKNNSTGVKGVYRHGEKFIASIQLNGKPHYLGIYKTVEEAALARKDGEEKYFHPILEKEKTKNQK